MSEQFQMKVLAEKRLRGKIISVMYAGYCNPDSFKTGVIYSLLRQKGENAQFYDFKRALGYLISAGYITVLNKETSVPDTEIMVDLLSKGIKMAEGDLSDESVIM